MRHARELLLCVLLLLALSFGAFWWRCLRSQREPGTSFWPTPIDTTIGFLTDFLDTLGIGSFAVTTTLYHWRSRVPDRAIPGTLNVGHALPTALQALIYISIIDIDVTTLTSMIAAAVLGAYAGAGLVSRLSERALRLGMASALLGAAALILARLLGLLPSGSDSLALSGGWLVIGLVGNWLLGALMTFGIGLYAPCMVLVSLLGMNPKAAFPIMMGSCAFLMPVAALRFVRSASYAPRAALGLTIGGLPGVLIAAYVVKELPLDALRWLLVVVVAYTAFALLRATSTKAIARPTARPENC